MSLIKLPKQKTVSYMGEDIQIPENHNWVMLGFQETYTGLKLTIISSVEKPTSHAHGFKVDLSSDFKFISEVEDSAVAPKDSLVYVGEPTRDTLYDAFEVLVGDLVKIVNSDMHHDEKLHAVFCMEHGSLSQFLQKNVRELSDRFDTPSLDVEELNEALQASLDKAEMIKQITDALGISADNVRSIGGDELDEILSNNPKPKYS